MWRSDLSRRPRAGRDSACRSAERLRASQAYSATRSFVALVAGVSFDRGLLRPQVPGVESGQIAEPWDGRARQSNWQHLLQQGASGKGPRGADRRRSAARGFERFQQASERVGEAGAFGFAEAVQEPFLGRQVVR